MPDPKGAHHYFMPFIRVYWFKPKAAWCVQCYDGDANIVVSEYCDIDDVDEAISKVRKKMMTELQTWLEAGE